MGATWRVLTQTVITPTRLRGISRRLTAFSSHRNRGLSMATEPSEEWKHVQPNAAPPYQLFTKPIQKSQQDDREYRLIRLENGLQATLVHDPKADKAAASLDVAVGHLSDPDDMPGLAHFCEHLSFMGTKEFPRENEYQEFLAKHNGSSNAYTSTSNTNYYFSVETGSLAPALARFAGFFHSPLFSASCTSRELNAVDSEHKKNHQSDMWRIFQLNKHLSKAGHVWSKFGSGNRQSLSQAGRDMLRKSNADLPKSTGSSLAPSPIPSRIASPTPSTTSSSSELEVDGGAVGRETRRRLVEWWSKEYCAGRMRLCVIGKEPLDELAKLVSNMFSPVLNRGQEPVPMITEHPFGPDEMGTLVSVQTIMAFHALEISFPLAYQPPHWRYKPASFVSHFLGHEGPGSLHSYLMRKGWITSLSAGSQNLGRGFAMLKMTVYLTDEGFKNYRDIMLTAFKYLSLLRSSSFPAWHQRELHTLSTTRFRFAEKRRPDDYAVWISEHMIWPVPKELLLSAPQIVWEWNEKDPNSSGEQEVREVLEGLTVSKGRVVLMAKAEEHAKLGESDAMWEKEPWYRTAYRVERLDDKFTEQAQGPNDIPELYLPGPNEFIPTNLNVEEREITEPLKRPHLIRKTPLSSLWYKKDDHFWKPKAIVMIDIRSPVANTTPRAAVLTYLYTELVNDALNEFAYDASLAGLSYNLSAHPLGLFVALGGYNDKMAVLADHVLKKARSLVVSPERLGVFKEKCTRRWANFFLGKSYEISDYYSKYLLTDQYWSLEEKLTQVSLITVEEMQKHITDLLSEVNMRMLIFGNMHTYEAVSIAETTEAILGSNPTSTHLAEQALIIPEASNFIWNHPVSNPNEPNSALTYCLRICSSTDQRQRVIGALLSQILAEPAFNVLRTKEQLGYIVSCSPWRLPGNGEFGLRIVVQSERGPSYLEERVEAFLDGMKAVIEEMDAKEFEEQKTGLQRKWKEVSKNMNEEGHRYWNYIETGYLDFYRRDEDAKMLESVNKEEVLSLFLTHIHPSSSTRAKLSVHLRSQKPRPQGISPEAGEAFDELVAKADISQDKSWCREALGNCPPVPDFVKYWEGVLGEAAVPEEVKQELLSAIPQLAEKFPATVESDDSHREGAIYIEDVNSFKATLKVAEVPSPLVDWGDLPLSKV